MNHDPAFAADSLPSAAITSYRTKLNELGALESGPDVVGIRLSVPATSGPRKSIGNWHSHLRGQLLSVEDGMLEIHCTQGTWLVPPRCAVWIPPGISHAANVKRVTRSWNLYLSPSCSTRLQSRACVVAVSSLMQELVQRAVSWGDAVLDPAQHRILDVLLDEIGQLPQDNLHLPMPTDHRLLRIVRAALDELDRHRTLADWANWGGMSERTLTRLFQKEVDMSFARWLQLARLMNAMERLVSGRSVNEISDALGYSSPSHFILMFRRHFGAPPARYVARASQSGETPETGSQPGSAGR